VADAAYESHSILLEALTRTPPKAEPSSSQLSLEVLGCDGQTRGQPFHYCNEAGAVRLAGGEEAQHVPKVTRG